MTEQNVSRRESLRGIAIGTVLGGATFGASSIAAADERECEVADDRDDRPKRGGIELVPERADPALELAVFRVDNHTKRAATLEWETEDCKRDDGEKPTDERSVGERPDDGRADDKNSDDDRPDAEEVITFLDCQTVRVVGDFPEIVLYALELVELDDGRVALGSFGALPWGPVEGERTIDIEEELGEGTILSAVDVLDGPFQEGDIVFERLNPDLDRCIERLFADAGVDPADIFDENVAEIVSADGEGVSDIAPANRGTLTAAAGTSSYLPVHAPDGDANLRLRRDGEEIARADSATETPRAEGIRGIVSFGGVETAFESRTDGKNEP